MIGRGQEVDEIALLLADDAVHGVAIGGKAGVGKSRLAREAVQAAAASGWTVRSIAATATSRVIPLGAFSQWIDVTKYAPVAPVALARMVVEALTDGTQPERLVVMVDDAHLLDDLSALVLHQLVQAGAATVILTIRTDETAPSAVTALWKDGQLRRRDLEPLHRSEIHDLLTAVLGAVPDQRCEDRLWQLTQGNVLFLRQLVEQEHRAGRMVNQQGTVRWLADTPAGSGSLAELVDAQIGAIPAEVRDVVDLVAVAEPIDWHCLRQIADQHAIEDAEERELIRISGDDVYIGHPLYAEIRLNRCASSRLRRLRGQVATAMTASGGAAKQVKRGLLWLDSDLPPDTSVLLSAATAASSLMDFETAERLFTATVATGVGAQARIPLAFSLFMMQKGDLALEVLEGVGVDEATHHEFINPVVMRASNLLWGMRSPQRSWQLIDDALTAATGAHRLQLLVFRAHLLALAAKPVEVLETTADVDYRDLDHYGAAMAYTTESFAYSELGQPDQAAAKLKAAEQALTFGKQKKLLRQTMTEYHSFALLAGGRIAEALDVAERHRLGQHGEPMAARTVAAAISGMAMLAAGDIEAALRYLPSEIDADAVTSLHVVNSFHRFHLLRAQALARSGDSDAAERAIHTARAHRHPAYEYVTSTELLTEAWLAAVRYRLTEARELAYQAAQFARDHHQLAREVWCLQTAVQFDDTEAAERLAELAARVQGPRVAIAAAYAAALSADDADELDRVSNEFEAMGDLLAAADAAGQAATSHRRAGRSGSALTSAARANRLAIVCGGATSPAIRTADVVPPFSNREREIAVLVAQGLSNRAIAEEASLSVRTVESHIYRACTRAGVSGRSALAEMIRSSAG